MSGDKGVTRVLSVVGEPFPQRQDSLRKQLSDLRLIAVKLGMYDAADWIDQSFDQKDSGGIGWCGNCQTPDECDDKTLCFDESSDQQDSDGPWGSNVGFGLESSDQKDSE